MPRPAKGPRLYLKPASAGGRAVWIIRDGNQKLREEYLQPGEQPPGLAAIYDAAEALNIAVFNMIVRHIKNNQTSARKT